MIHITRPATRPAHLDIPVVQRAEATQYIVHSTAFHRGLSATQYVADARCACGWTSAQYASDDRLEVDLAVAEESMTHEIETLR